MKQAIFLDDYERTQFLGQGTYGVVYKAKSKKTNQIIAVKNIKLQSRDEGIPSTTLRQISILRQLAPHPNIIYLKHVLYELDRNKLDLVFQYADFDLKKYLGSRKDYLSKSQIKNFMYQLINGINYCHSKRVIHRDLKPQNILVTEDKTIKIGDFGLARVFNIPLRTLTHQIQTLWYRAPQILLGQKQYSLGVDIWAVGCIFVQLIQKTPLFKGTCQIDQLFQIFQILGTPTKQSWPSVVQLPYFKPTFPKFQKQNIQNILKRADKQQLNLLQKMLNLDPLKRISMKQALKHKYFDDIDPQIKQRYNRRQLSSFQSNKQIKVQRDHSNKQNKKG